MIKNFVKIEKQRVWTISKTFLPEDTVKVTEAPSKMMEKFLDQDFLSGCLCFLESHMHFQDSRTMMML